MNGPYSTTARNKAYAKAMSPDGRSSPNRGASPHSKGSHFDGQEWVPVETAEDLKNEVARLQNYISDIRDNADEIDSAMGTSDWESRMARNALDNLKQTCEEALAEASSDE